MQWNQFYSFLYRGYYPPYSYGYFQPGNTPQTLNFNQARYFLQASIQLDYFLNGSGNTAVIHVEVTLRRGGVALGTVTFDATVAGAGGYNPSSLASSNVVSVAAPFETVPLTTPNDVANGSTYTLGTQLANLYSDAFRLIPDFYADADRQIEVDITAYTQFVNNGPSNGSSFVESNQVCQVTVFASSDPFPNIPYTGGGGGEIAFNAPSVSYSPSLYLPNTATISSTYRWRHGDGSDYEGAAPHTHTYDEDGTYAAKILAFDNQYGWGEGGTNITVSASTRTAATSDFFGVHFAAVKSGANLLIKRSLPGTFAGRETVATLTNYAAPTLLEEINFGEHGALDLMAQNKTTGFWELLQSLDYGESWDSMAQPFDAATYKQATACRIAGGGRVAVAVRKSDSKVVAAYAPDGATFEAIQEIGILADSKAPVVYQESPSDGSRLHITDNVNYGVATVQMGGDNWGASFETT